MSKTIYKYRVPVNDETHIVDLPRSAEIVRVASQHNDAGNVFFWAVVDLSVSGTQRRYMKVVGTGHIWPDGAQYVGSADISNGTLVWHLLELDS